MKVVALNILFLLQVEPLVANHSSSEPRALQHEIKTSVYRSSKKATSSKKPSHSPTWRPSHSLPPRQPFRWRRGR
jgi:hypothetical protein